VHICLNVDHIVLDAFLFVCFVINSAACSVVFLFFVVCNDFPWFFVNFCHLHRLPCSTCIYYRKGNAVWQFLIVASTPIWEPACHMGSHIVTCHLAKAASPDLQVTPTELSSGTSSDPLIPKTNYLSYYTLLFCLGYWCGVANVNELEPVLCFTSKQRRSCMR